MYFTTTITTSYSVLNNIKVVLIANASTAITVTLPDPAKYRNREITLTRFSSSDTANITVNTVTGNVENPANNTLVSSFAFGSAVKSLTYISDSIAWHIISSNITALEADVADLTTLSGVASNATTLGTFTGTTIPDSSTVKAALQSLETALEANTGASPLENEIRVVSVNTTLSTTTDGTVVFDTAGTVATLPSPTNKKQLVVKNVSTGNITVTGHIDGNAAQTFTIASLESFRFHSSNSSWYLIA